jgi:hypothetical protein
MENHLLIGKDDTLFNRLFHVLPATLLQEIVCCPIHHAELHYAFAVMY